MKIAVVGSEGYIGKLLVKKLKELGTEVVEIDQGVQVKEHRLNLLQPKLFDYKVLVDCEYVIFTAAISSPDLCFSKYEMAYEINVSGTGYFINEALKSACRVVFFSSDAVFGEDIGSPFTEDSSTKANTAYGKMKKDIEDQFCEFEDFKAIRLSYVISKDDRFTTYLANCSRDRKIAEVFHPFYRSCIVLEDVIQTVLWLLKNWESLDSSFVNVCGKELVSRIQIADELNRAGVINVDYILVKPQKEFYQNRPHTTEMKSLYLNRIIKRADETFSEKIKRQFL